jgi:hypothetical protein
MPIAARAARGTTGSLEVTWRTHTGAIDRDYEIFLERLVRHVETALARIHRHSVAPIVTATSSFEKQHEAQIVPVLRDAS